MMRGIFIHYILIVTIKLLAIAQHYFPSITEVLECMYQYEQQCIINFYENHDYHQIEYYEGLL